MAGFDQGSTCSDFDPDLFDVTAYGLCALVAGKVIVKTGFFAVAFILLKKFSILIVVGIGAAIKGLFSKKKDS